jgi:tRNA pseudouridine55 synthase
MTDRASAPPCGILLVRKPEGISSARVVATAKRTLGGYKVGHLGTLDPFAGGLLPLAVGEGTKLAPYLNEADKRYVGVVRLGATTDTLDRTGTIVEEKAFTPPTEESLSAIATELAAIDMQMPPAFSAIKQGGVPVYRMARQGIAVALQPRPVRIFSLDLAFRAPAWIDVQVHCSKGTYVRALARDLGQRLGTVALLETLTRTAFGPFPVERALDLACLEEAGGAALSGAAWVDAAEALAHLRALPADAAAVQALRAGRQAILASLAGPPRAEEGHARVVDSDGRLVAILAAEGARWTIDRVFG